MQTFVKSAETVGANLTSQAVYNKSPSDQENEKILDKIKEVATE
jgi:hypothetical protein